MAESTEVEYLLTINADVTFKQLQKVEAIIMRMLSFAKRLSGDENLDQLIMKLQQTISWVRSLQLAITAMQAAMIPGAGWLAAIWGGLALANSAFSAYDLVRGT